MLIQADVAEAKAILGAMRMVAMATAATPCPKPAPPG